MSSDLFSADRDALFIRQRKEWTEILIDWETRNQYVVMDGAKNEIATIAEKAGGFGDFLKRSFLRSHRPFEIGIFGIDGTLLASLARSFFFLFSDLEVRDGSGAIAGHVKRRFGLLYRKYDLLDGNDQCFAQIKGPVWRIWTFPVRDTRGTGEARIAKRWGGGLREIFSDADTFMLDFMQGSWTPAERRVLLAAAISIDFDFFENNSAKGGLFD